MNKRLLMILIGVITLFLMIGAVSARDSLTVGFDDNFPPFTYKDASGEFTGFEVELAKEVCKRNNWTFVPQPVIDWNNKNLELNSNEIDCLWGEFSINGREDTYTLSEPYYNNSVLVVVKSDSGISNLNDLNGKRVELETGVSAIDSLKENNKSFVDSLAGIDEVNDDNAALMDLDSGVCDAIILDGGFAYYQVSNANTGYSFKVDFWSIAVMMYEFMCGGMPFGDEEEETMDIYLAIINE